jgi:hypothetical protein
VIGITYNSSILLHFTSNLPDKFGSLFFLFWKIWAERNEGKFIDILKLTAYGFALETGQGCIETKLSKNS